MENIDKIIVKFCEKADTETLVKVLELSDQPLLLDLVDGQSNPENILRPVAVQFLGTWVGAELEHDLAEMPYGDYMEMVDHWLAAHDYEETSELEMETVDQMQCDLELPHVCALAVLKRREDVVQEVSDEVRQHHDKTAQLSLGIRSKK